MTTIPNLPRILTATPGKFLLGTNRFTAPQATVHYGIPFERLLRGAHCTTHPDCYTGQEACDGMFPRRGDVGSRIFAFEVVRFEAPPSVAGTSREQVDESLREVGLRPATFEELMAFITKYSAFIGTSPLIALCQSNKAYLREEWKRRHWLKRLLKRLVRRGFERTVQIRYPLVEHRLLKLTQANGFQGHCLFLGTYVPLEIEAKLVNLPITTERYQALPDAGSASKQTPLGTMLRAKDGHLCEVVKGEDMFSGQCAAMSPPERGFRHYRPIFVDTPLTTA